MSNWTGLKKRQGLHPVPKRLSWIEPQHPQLSIVQQCALLQLNRSTYYYEPRPQLTHDDQRMMQQMDRIYTRHPYYGYRRIRQQLKRDGQVVNHKRIHRLMQVMGIQGLYPRPRTSIPAPNHAIYPYLLTNVHITQPNQVWGTDITYIPGTDTWYYLVAILDWYSRYVVSWQLSETMQTDFCIVAAQQALVTAQPDIHNSDQGAQFTSHDYLATLQQYPTIRLSMDHRGRCFDNIFTERLWRTVKYEEVYLKEYTSFTDAKQSLQEYFTKYNLERLHSSLNYKTPAEVYFAG